jgi:hypothetical protein
MRINGFILFAGIMMAILGTMSAINGLIALFNDEAYIVTDQNVIGLDFTTWGWVHLIVGIIVVFAGFGLMSGAIWARLVAALLAGVVIVEQFGTIQAYPFWSVAMIGISIAIIYSVCTMGRVDEEVELPM